MAVPLSRIGIEYTKHPSRLMPELVAPAAVLPHHAPQVGLAGREIPGIQERIYLPFLPSAASAVALTPPE